MGRDPRAVAPGTTAQEGAWVRASGPLIANESFRIVVWPGVEANDCTPSSPAAATLVNVQPGTSWTYYEASFTQPAGYFYVRPAWVVMSISAASTTGSYLDLDDLTLRFN